MSKRHGAAGEPASEFFKAGEAQDLSPAEPGAPNATAVLGVGVVRKVAYHAGPPHITFFGRLWYRGKPQEIPEADWEAMKLRPDSGTFEFRTVQ